MTRSTLKLVAGMHVYCAAKLQSLHVTDTMVVPYAIHQLHKNAQSAPSVL